MGELTEMDAGRTSTRLIDRLTGWLTPLRIALLYVAFGLVLLVVSDLYWPAVIADVEQLRQVQGLKGAFEVLVTGAVIYGLVRLFDEGREESEERYRRLLQASPAPINLFDEDAVTVWGNDAVVDLLGFESRDDLVGRSIFEFIHVEDHDLAREELRSVIQGKEATGPTRMQLTRADGEVLDIRVATAPGRFGGRDVGQAVVIDDTRRLDLQSTVESQQRFIGLALDSLQDVFYVLDAEGGLVRWNETVEGVTGYDAETLESLDGIEAFFVEEDRERVRASVRRVLETGTDEVQATVLTCRGHTIEYEFRGRRLTDTDGNVVGMVGIGRDVSARVARERHLWNTDRLLQHQLRNQLNVIIGLAEELEDGRGPSVGDASERLVGLVGSVLSLVEKNHEIVETLTGQVAPMDVDLVPPVRRAVETVEARHPEADVEVDLPASAVVHALPKLEAVVVELLENAVVHTDEPSPQVRLAVDRSGGEVRIRVTDGPPAIPLEERELILGDRAFGTTGHTEGLGLWLVQWVVSASGGTLAFDESGDGGNVVTVALPAGVDVERELAEA